MPQSYDLTQLDAHSFEHLVNFLSLKVLGKGVTGFAAGPDGGRDGFLHGKASYPSPLECWEGTWFLQSKYHKPHLSKNPQKWLIEQVEKEISEFEVGNRTNRPNNWIIATNIEPSGSHKTGAFDRIKSIVSNFDSNINVDIWGGRKILDFLHENPEAASAYGHFLTPGHVITELYKSLKDKKNDIQSVIDHLIVSQFHELSYTKLEQAGSMADNRPKLYELFKDLPFQIIDDDSIYFIMDSLVCAASNVQKVSIWNEFGDGWHSWAKNPRRSRVILLKGGPGQGKSTAGQYFAQIQRAAHILSENGPKVSPQIKEIARDFQRKASEHGFWPAIPRIPLFIELKDFANWYINKNAYDSKNIIAYICYKINKKTYQNITAEMLHEALGLSSWFVNFDGLDEVPNDVKDEVANEIISFTNELIPRLDADVLVLCTTRPQGYSGQFDDLYSANVTLTPLPEEIALECASAVVRFNRSGDESEQYIAILKSAMESDQVRELMTTPLQSHIMAVVVRDGGRPPEKRWELFNNFYSVMKKRESLKDFQGTRIAALLREQDQLLKSIHDRLGVCLHAKAEIGSGAEATLNREEFQDLARQTVMMQFDSDIDITVDTLMEATTERLVFVNTPESSNSVRFDIRQLQEFFAAEFIYSAVENDELQKRIEIIGSDAHWREVVHFLLSALTHNKRLSELAVAVNIIQQLDDDGQNHKIRSFKRKMGAGSLFALRLLEEGMLEQDKRIRHQFTKSLTPLWGMLDKESLNKIISVKKEHSKHWLISNMINDFLELDYSEHISLGYLLSVLLDANHSRIAEVKDRFNNAPEFYIIATLNLYSEGFRNSSTHNPQVWFLELIIKKLFNAKTNNTKTQKQAVNFIFLLSEFVLGEINEIDVSDDVKYLVKVLVKKDTPVHLDREEHIVDNPYCFFAVKLKTPNWFDKEGKDTLEKHIFTDENHACSVKLLIAILKFHFDESVISFRDVIYALLDNDHDTFIIPGYVKALLPVNIDIKNSNINFRDLSHCNDAELKLFIDSCKKDIPNLPSYIDHFIWDGAEFDKNKWARLCNDLPDIALKVWAGLTCSPLINTPRC
ncbi:NACHT domain-containing protein [Pantoea allii]|uniref:NACHT domain-containing protein n=1 Tax=Pantoea allii TaxID=574096 RepID=UPI003D316161